MASYTWTCPAVKGLVGVCHHGSRHLLIPIRCKRWTCTYCARVNLKHLTARILRGKPNKFITLTCLPFPGETPEAVYKRHRPEIRKLNEWIRNHYGDMEACCITELHKSGMPHWHLVARCGFIPQKELSAKWAQLTGSKIVDIRKISHPSVAARYVAKYVTKSFGKDRPEWLKRVAQFTRNYAAKLKFSLPAGFDFYQTNMTWDECITAIEVNHWIHIPVEQGQQIQPPSCADIDDPRQFLIPRFNSSGKPT